MEGKLVAEQVFDFLLVPKLLLGNGVFEAPASRRTTKQ